MLSKILVMQHNMEEMLVDLKRSTGAPSREPLPEGAPQLPLKAEVEVQQLEQWLLDKANKCSIINYLALVGGKNVEKATRNIMGQFFSKDVAPSFNWLDEETRWPFPPSRLRMLLLMLLSKEQVNTVSMVEEAIKMWLKAAKC
ncbi:uncharacterized protein [Parasteatoda tepidariorum]|uniref:uncharacterized protein n=1 Tax=Parasteatoda tepidariorum TaxID=114398 RepID=UPI0039BC231E